MKKADEPAYPITSETREARGQVFPGLTKREYFAALILQGVVSYRGFGAYSDVSRESVRHADALITALEIREDQEK